MKKVLLGTSALIAAGMVAAPAMAQEQIQLGIGGKMEQYFAITSFDNSATTGGDLGAAGISTDTEVYFTGATTLDNGLTVGAVIQLEAQTNSTDNADEQYAYIEGAFGRLQAGQKNGVSSSLSHVAPVVGPSLLDAATFADQAMNTVKGPDTTFSSDDASLNYYTPSLAGFTAGVTYTPEPGGALLPETESTVDRDLSNEFEVALAYNGEFSGVGVGVDVSYIHADADVATADDRADWRGGLVLSYAGFSFGGSYAHIEDTTTGDDDGRIWDIGAAYETGPYGVSLTYVNSHQEMDNGAAPDTDMTYQQLHLGGSYTMGPGIDLVGAGFWSDFEQDNTTGTDEDGGGVIVGLQLTF